MKPSQKDCERVREATRHLVREFDVFRNARPLHGLNLSQSHVLIEIGQRGAMTMIELTQLLGLNKSSISRILTFLRGSALISQLPNPNDTRVKPYTLTEKGKKVLSDINNETNERVLAALAQVDDCEKIIDAMNLYAEALHKTRMDQTNSNQE